jgi:hypothetical protein
MGVFSPAAQDSETPIQYPDEATLRGCAQKSRLGVSEKIQSHQANG